MIDAFSNNIPIFIQLEDDIRLEIVSGILKPNEKLDTVRTLALKYKVNPNTIQKALATLEKEKLIYTESTNGKYVTNNIKLIEKTKKEIAKRKTLKYLQDMNDLNIYDKEIINIIKEEL